MLAHVSNSIRDTLPGNDYAFSDYIIYKCLDMICFLVSGCIIHQKRKNKLLELLKVNVTSQNFRRSSIQNSQPATERLLNIAPSVISNPSENKAENDKEYDVYVDISELENTPSPIECSPTIYESFEDIYEGRFQY